MDLRRFLNITVILFTTLMLNSCSALNVPLNAASTVLNTTANVAGAGVRTAGAIVGAPVALMQ